MRLTPLFTKSHQVTPCLIESGDHSRENDGRFVVPLPRKSDAGSLENHDPKLSDDSSLFEHSLYGQEVFDHIPPELSEQQV